MSKKVINRLLQRIRNNGSIVPRKRGKQRLVT